MIDRFAIRTRLDHERRHLCRDGEVIEVLPFVTRLHAEDHSHHTVIWSSLTPANADAVIEQEIDAHARLGAGFEWKLYSHDTPGDLLDRLRRRAFQIGPREAVLVFDLAGANRWWDEPISCRVEPVDRLERVAAYQRVAEAIFDKDYSFTAGQIAQAIRAGSTQHRGYVAYAGDEPVSIGRLYAHPASWFGGLYGGATLPACRGKGCYRALVAARARDAVRLGARYLIVDALPTSRPILERLGFEWVADTWPCEFGPPG